MIWRTHIVFGGNTMAKLNRKQFEYEARSGKGPMLQPQTVTEIAKLTPGTVAEASMTLGVREHEPLLIAMDAMLRYAVAYEKAYESKLGTDGVLGDEWFSAVAGIRGLLNGQGAVAMERDISTDSKDNGVIESIYWLACAATGIDGEQ